jgi:hypothetical protein
MGSWEENLAASHLSKVEQRCASHFLKVAPDDIRGPLCGVLVGECPGVATRPYLPMFPYPPNSAGGRLLKYSQMKAADYLGKLRRVNMFFTHQPRWPGRVTCTERVLAMHDEFQTCDEKRVVLLGSKVGRAFGFDAYWQASEKDEVSYCVIPHPSGLNLIYNDRKAQLAAAAVVRWAAGDCHIVEMGRALLEAFQ